MRELMLSVAMVDVGAAGAAAAAAKVDGADDSQSATPSTSSSDGGSRGLRLVGVDPNIAKKQEGPSKVRAARFYF